MKMKARGAPAPMEASGGEGAGGGAQAGRAALGESVQTPEPTLYEFGTAAVCLQIYQRNMQLVRRVQELERLAR